MTQLPSDGIADRITEVVDAAYEPTTATGRIGQPKWLHQEMVRRFGKRAPAYMTVTRWLGQPKRLTVDAVYMIAMTVGVDPAVLAFGEIVTRPLSEREPEKEGLEVQRARKQRRAHGTRPASQGDARSGGSGRKGA